ncbi:transposon-related protein [Staphylococcus schleiferi]|nr:hypothetical protein [Staphylococcus pseudintermedius]BAS44888.1 transposon-related protein [Staphylococcus schleiferi]
MDFYTAEELKPYAHHLKLSNDILHYVASRINWGDKLSLMQLSKEIQSKFNDSYVKQNTPKGRPIVYGDLCLLCINLSQDGHGRMLQVDLTDCVYIGDVERYS